MFFKIIFPKRLWSIFMKCYILIILRLLLGWFVRWLACSEMNVIISFNQFNILIMYIDCVKDTHEKIFESELIVYSKYESLW